MESDDDLAESTLHAFPQVPSLNQAISQIPLLVIRGSNLEMMPKFAQNLFITVKQLKFFLKVVKLT